MNHWDFLGLEGESASEREVKRAYAKLLKKNRPDQDPEGFARVHEAYEDALNDLKWREVDDAAWQDPNPITPGETAPEVTLEEPEEALVGRSDVEVYPPEIRARSEAVKAALRDGNREGIEDAVMRLDEALTEVPNGQGIWASLLEVISEEERALLFEVITPGILVRELACNRGDFSLEAISSWTNDGRFEKLQKLAEGIKNGGGVMGTEATGQVAAVLVYGLSVVDPTLAEDMLDLAYEWLPVSQRDWRLPMLEGHLINGAVFARFPWEQRVFWAKCLADPEGQDWESEECRNAVVHLLEEVDPDWSGYEALTPVLPEDLYSLVDQRRRVRRRNSYEESYAGKSRADSNGSLILCSIFALFFGFIFFGGADGCNDHGSDIHSERNLDIERWVEIGNKKDQRAEKEKFDNQQWLVNEFPDILEVEKKVPKGPAMIEHLREKKGTEGFEDESKYEALIAYLYLMRADKASIEALLRFLPEETALDYLKLFKDSMTGVNRLLVKQGIDEILKKDTISITEKTRSELRLFSENLISVGTVIRLKVDP